MTDKIKMPVFDNHKQCSVACGIPNHVLSVAKNQGCDGFNHGRVDLEKFLRWYFAQDEKVSQLPSGFSSWRDHLNFISSARQTILLERDKGSVLDKDQVGFAITQGIGSLFNSIERALVRDFPSQCAGLSEIQIARRGSILVSQLEDELRETLSKMAGSPIPKREMTENETQRVVDQTNHEKAFSEHCSADWGSFVQWRESTAATTREKRRAWCVQRAAENLPVPDASDSELAATPGLKRS